MFLNCLSTILIQNSSKKPYCADADKINTHNHYLKSDHLSIDLQSEHFVLQLLRIVSAAIESWTKYPIKSPKRIILFSIIKIGLALLKRICNNTKKISFLINNFTQVLDN